MKLIIDKALIKKTWLKMTNHICAKRIVAILRRVPLPDQTQGKCIPSRGMMWQDGQSLSALTLTQHEVIAYSQLSRPREVDQARARDLAKPALYH